MIYWAPFLHFYQPPTQFHSILDRICNESYRPIIKMLAGRPNAKVTVNMCGVLTEMLKEHGHRDIIEGLKELGESGFVIDKLEEWVSKRESRPGERARAENSAREEIPLFLALSAVKTSP